MLGTTFGYPTQTLPLLKAESNPDLNLNDDEGASFAFLTPLMAMLFATTGGTLSSLIGRKRLIMSCMPFTGLGWLLIGLSNGKTMLFIGRIVTSIFMAFMTSSVSAYTAETVHPQITGNLVVLSPFFLCGREPCHILISVYS